jgi:hypothetical protein
MLLTCTGCSVNRPVRTADYGSQQQFSEEKELEEVKRQNIGNGSFFIQKAEIEVSGEEGVEKLIASVKFIYPDRYSVSIRNRAGIEAARIFISSDTILVNDRINRKQYCASPQYMYTKYGITISGLPIIFGDFVGENLSEVITDDCSDGFWNAESLLHGKKINYVIDCKKGKLASAVEEKDTGRDGIIFKFSEYFKSVGRYIPGKIEIMNVKSFTIITVRIGKIIYPWDGTIEFIPGNRYEIIIL